MMVRGIILVKGRRFRAILTFLLCLACLFVALFALPSPAMGYFNFDSSNGNQELLADPCRPLVYYADHAGEVLVIWNYSSGTKVSVEVGAAPISLELGPGGRFLYVAVSGDRELVAVDVEREEVDLSLDLGFVPLSAAMGSADSVLVSSLDDTLVRRVNLTSGLVETCFDPGFHAILESDLEKGEMVAIEKWNENATMGIVRYSLAPPVPSVIAQKNVSDCGLTQYVVDWDGGAIYISAYWNGGFQKRSLSSLELTGEVPTWNAKNGIALSPDGDRVYGLTVGSYWEVPGGAFFDSWGSMVYVIDAHSWQLMALKFVPGESAAIVAGNDPSSTFLASPLERLEMQIEVATVPGSGTTYGYTPSQIRFWLPNMTLPAFPPGSVDLLLDSSALTMAQQYDGSYIATIASPMAHGRHEIALDAGLGIKSRFNFTIDPDSPVAIVPTVLFESPAPASRIGQMPAQLTVSYVLSDPAPLSQGIELAFEGAPLSTFSDEWRPNTFHAYVPYQMFEYRLYNISTTMSWPGGSHTYSSNFTYQQFPYIAPVYPAQETVLPARPYFVAAQLFVGRPAVPYDDVEVTVDGLRVPFYSVWHTDIEVTFYANLTMSMGSGRHVVVVRAATDAGLVDMGWAFSIDQVGMNRYNVSKGYSLLLPDTWLPQEDYDLEGERVDLYALGPVISNHQASLIAYASHDRTIRGGREFLHGQIMEIMEEVEGDGYVVTEQYEEISGHPAVIFTIQWRDVYVTQKGAIVVNASSHSFWFLLFSISSGSFQDYEPVFDQIISSLEIWQEPSAFDLDLTSAFVTIGLAVAVTVAVVLVVVAVVLARRRKNAQIRVCTGCGRQIPTDNNICPYCGKPRYQQQPYYSPSTQPYQQQQLYEPAGGLKYVLYLLSFFGLIIGLIIFLIWKNDPSPEKRHVGKNCLIISVASFLLSILSAVLLSLFWVYIFGMS